MISNLGNESSYFQDERELQNTLNIQNRGIFTNTQPFEFVIDQNGNKITLGEGSFGFVLLIKNIKTNQLYALKLIPINSIETVTNKRIIEREVRVHPDLSHPYIIKMHDAFINKDAIYIILDYAVNKTVSDTFLLHFQYDEERAFKYFYQTCLAIDYLHKKGIMHRDIKKVTNPSENFKYRHYQKEYLFVTNSKQPENLLLDQDDNIKMCDFGWCAEITKTRRNTLCGTYEYMAPETIMEKEYDYRIDIWQLGILLYELLHGRTPFKPQIELSEEDRMEYFQNTINQGHVVFDSHISPAAISLISQILIYVPEKRLSLQGILAHIWVFQMKAKTGYKDSEEILNQYKQTEQDINQVKENQELELLQTQKIMKSRVSMAPLPKNFSTIQTAPINRTSQNIFFSGNTGQVPNERTSIAVVGDGGENNRNTIKLPDWNSNINVNASIEKKNLMKKTQSEIKEPPLTSTAGSIVKKNVEKELYKKNPIYERELARMSADNEKDMITLDLQDLPLKNDNKNTDLKQFFYMPSYVQRRDFQQQMSYRTNTAGKLSMFKMSTQFDINFPTSNKRTIFGDFDLEKKQRKIQELEKLVEQVDVDKLKKTQQTGDLKGNQDKQKLHNHMYNDSISEMSQVSSVKYGSVFQTKKQ